MPLDPPFDADDSQQWSQFGPPLRITVHPAAPPNPQPGVRAASKGVNDWIVPDVRPEGRVMPDGYPDDWVMSDGYPDDWITPAPSTAHTQPVPSTQPTATNPSISNRSAAPPDPYAAYWAMIPASRVGAMAWHPPIFPNSFGQFPLAPSAPPNIPPGGLFDSLANLERAPRDSPIPTSGGLLGALANLQPAPSGPVFNAWEGPFSPLSGAQPVPTFRSALFSGPPFEAASGIGDQYPRRSLLGNQAGLTPAQPNQSVDTNGFPVFNANGFPVFNANGMLPAGLGATPLAATASFARGGSSPAGSVLPGSNSNPFSRILNALNPISSASAADEEGWGFPPVIAQALAQGLIDLATAKRLTERAKVLQDAQDAWNDLREVAQGRASSPALGAALEASGISRPKGYAAHHIAAGNEDRAEYARIVLRKFGIGINDAVNGVFLPANRATQIIAGKTIHSTLHTIKYYDAVNDALEMAKTREEAIETLHRIGQALQSGNFP